MLNLPPLRPQFFRRTPTLTIVDTVIGDMYLEVLAHPTLETAWGLAGYYTVADNLVDSVTITNVIPPATDVVRNVGTAALGGDHQVKALEWLFKNYQANARRNGSAPEVTFGYLYKGHSHHTMSIRQYSGTDMASIKSSVSQDGLLVAVGPLANILTNETRIIQGGNDGVLEVEGRQNVSLKFYFLTKHMNDRHQEPILLEPRIVKASDLPIPPPRLSWQFTNRHEYLEQIAHLETRGCKISVNHRDADTSDAELEIEFLVTHPQWRGTLQIITQPDYPATPPVAKVIAARGHSQVAIIHSHNPELDTEVLWQPGEDFIQTIFRLEARGEL